jgi:hypothetical protein
MDDDRDKPRVVIVRSSEIKASPGHRLDAEYWLRYRQEQARATLNQPDLPEEVSDADPGL